MRESVHKRIKVAAAQAGLQMQEYVMRAVESYSALGFAEEPKKYVREKAILERALDLLPEYASSQVRAIEVILESAPKYKVKDDAEKKAPKRIDTARKAVTNAH